MSGSRDRVGIVDGGLAALRQRMSQDERFRYRKHELFTTVFTTPLTIDMLLGDHGDALRIIVNAIRELHGEDVELAFDMDGNEVLFSVKKWRDEAHLRSLDEQVETR